MSERPDYEKVHEVLRRPFPANVIGKLPKPYKKDSPKGRCDECGGWHGLPAVHLDYVGHAAVTDRLLEADPTWTWYPYATDHDGLPRIYQGQGGDMVLWITLRVGGMERIGVGTAPAGSFELEKQLVSDAIRNAAMRFGVALDLWSKEDLHGTDDEPTVADTPAVVEAAVTTAKGRMTARQHAVNEAKARVLDLADGDRGRAKVWWDEAVRTLGVIEKAMTAEQAQAAANRAADNLLNEPELLVVSGEQGVLPEGTGFLPDEEVT